MLPRSSKCLNVRARIPDYTKIFTNIGNPLGYEAKVKPITNVFCELTKDIFLETFEFTKTNSSFVSKLHEYLKKSCWKVDTHP